MAIDLTVLKLISIIDWNWIWVTAPLWIPVVIVFVVLCNIENLREVEKMKIYYYYFDGMDFKKFVHEVEERKRTYRVTDGELEWLYIRVLNKNCFGVLIDLNEDFQYVLLTEDDEERAKKLFAEYYRLRICKKEKEIEEMKAVVEKLFL